MLDLLLDLSLGSIHMGIHHKNEVFVSYGHCRFIFAKMVLMCYLKCISGGGAWQAGYASKNRLVGLELLRKPTLKA